jgi:DNA replication and repair protein RecF
VYASHLTLHQFRSHAALELALEPGVTAFLGPNGQGKTNIVEALDYLARLSSHRVASDAPLVTQGCEQALVRAAVVKDGRTATLEVEINPGKANLARVNRSPLPRARDVVGLLRTVLFSPEDLALVKGDPGERRRFLDDLLVLRSPRLAGVRADYDRVLKQRNALLKQASGRAQSSSRGRGPDEHFESTLAVWDEQLVRLGAELTAARATLVADLLPPLAEAYASVAKDAGRNDASLRHQPSVVAEDPLDREALASAFAAQLTERRREEVQRGVTLVGPHRDELALTVGTMPVKGYASHGETWSYALALRLASYSLLRSEGDDPILILDDVFAELDTDRRDRLAEMVAETEQVLVTAAVDADVPEALRGHRVEVRREAGS